MLLCGRCILYSQRRRFRNYLYAFPIYLCQFVHGNSQEETTKGVANSSCSANSLGSWLGRVRMAKTITAVEHKNIFMIPKIGVLLLKNTLVFQRKFNSIQHILQYNSIQYISLCSFSYSIEVQLFSKSLDGQLIKCMKPVHGVVTVSYRSATLEVIFFHAFMILIW